MKEQEIEQELQRRGLNAPRLTPEMIDKAIVSEQYHTFSGKHMVCCLTLENGFTVIGEAAVVSPKNFREDIGQRISYEKAREKVWGVLAYQLQQKVFDEELTRNGG